MSFFKSKYKNNDEKFLIMKTFFESIGELIKQDTYISKKKYLFLAENAKETFSEISTLESNNTLDYWCRTTKSNPDDVQQFRYSYSHIQETIDKHNELFVLKHLKNDKEYLDNILKKDDPNIVLDEDQRKVVLNDEDYTLVIAGAGAGKTTTLEAKAKYLVDKKKVDPKRILVVSFTRKATNELQERFDKIGIPATISTFHSIGNTIINENSGRHKIVGSGFMYEKIKDYLETRLDDEAFIKKIMLFFASYLDIPFDSSKSVELYKKSLSNSDLTTMKSDLDDFKSSLVQKKITIRSERVRSVQECQIANFLYINGIDYEYEPIYPYCIIGTSTPYTPDFKLTQGNHVAYLEHYGISESGYNWRFTNDELEKYKKHIKDKEALHRIHHTELLHTYSVYNDKKDLITHLKEELTKHGFIYQPRDNQIIYKEIAQRAEDRYFTKLIQLLCNFINRFKTNNYKLEQFSDFQATARENGDERTLLFLEIARQCYIHYDSILKENKAIDFEDMINNAAKVLDQKIANKEMIPYDYIFIDEYQDMSFQRFNLAEKLSKCSNAKIVAVGDDWQSIYRFSGSDITLFTDFQKRMGYGQILYLTNTHRNSQELINIAGSFVMKNDLQKKKHLNSSVHIKDPVLIMSYDDSYVSKQDYQKNPNHTPYYQMGLAIEKALELIHNEFGDNKTVLLLGRYNFDGKNLNKLSDIFHYNERTVKSKRFPKMKIKFMTAHSSKGLGADNVILINGKDDILGFPSKIEDDPVMKLVLKDAKEMDYAEERRLFYVALTRTKNRVYLITPKNKPSQFILEIKDSFTNIVLNGPALIRNVDADYRLKCPICGYPLQIRKRKLGSNNKEFTLYVCSNDPEVCGFVTNDYSGGTMAITKCPKCEDGYLVVKKIKTRDGVDTGKRMLGCTNYKTDNTGCRMMITQEEYQNTWEKMSRKRTVYHKNGDVLPIDKCVLAGFPIMDLFKVFKYVIGDLSVEKNFNFNRFSLTDFLIGKDNKALLLYHLEKEKGYGEFPKADEKLLYAIIDSLLRFGFFEISEEKYKSLKLSNIEITEDFARTIFELFVH